MQQPMDKAKWVDLFEALGLDDAAMARWHALFEARYPAGHQAFLEWLDIAPPEIGAIRSRARI